MNESCFRFVLMYGTCVQCLLKLLFSDMRVGVCFAMFLLLEARKCKFQYRPVQCPQV